MPRRRHKWGHWQSLVLNGRLRRGIDKPTRPRLLVRWAIMKLGMKYREIVPFMNPLHRGGAVQWLDFCVWSGKKMFVIMFPPNGSHPYEKNGLEHKKQLLREKGIPYIVVPRHHTSQIYATMISNFVRKEAA